ncbi:serine/threonine protein kinase [Actinomadura sp. HBU206391]|nr:serine/threonine protein kinase [Actinomadura sp. HBU206391]
MGTWALPGYTELRELGAGGFGRVVLARHDASGSLAAIKYLSPRLLEDGQFVTAFRAEARTLARLRDPHIARLYGYAETPLGAAIVMEAVNGASLAAVLREHGALGPEAALVVLKGSLLGLAAAHASGVVHRDYKPANVLVQGDGRSKLVDFGIAVRSGEAGARAGTPAYMAPEQWRGEPVAPATDVYAATCVFFECVTGHRPYRADTTSALMSEHINAPVPVEDLPEPVRPLVARGLAKDPAQRVPGAAAFVAELEAAAVAGYGPDWEVRGLRGLAACAAAIAAVFPLALLVAASGGGAMGGAVGQGAASAVGHLSGRSLLAKIGGAKAALATATAVVVATTGAVVVTGVRGRPDPPAPRPTPRPTLALDLASLTGDHTEAGLTVRAQYVKVSGLADAAVEQRVNQILRAPVEQMMEHYRSELARSRNAFPTATPFATETTSAGSDVVWGLRGPRLLSLRYAFDPPASSGIFFFREFESLSTTVTVDLTTGRRLGAREVFRARTLTASGMTALTGMLRRHDPERDFCPGYLTSPRVCRAVTPAELTDQNPPVEFMFTARNVEFSIALPSLDYPTVAGVRLFKVPHAEIADLIRPEVAALLPGAAPTPARS